MYWRTSRSCLALVFSSLLFLAATHAQTAPASQSAPPYKNTSLPVDQRVADLLKRMTLEEKATMLSGSGWMESAPIERLGIPAIKMADGPMGVRSWAGSSAITNSTANPVKVETTAFPSGVAMAATWDTALVQREGQAIAAGSQGAGPRHDPRTDRQHQSRSIVGTQLRGLRRRSVPRRAAGRRLRPRCAGRRRYSFGEAFRRKQRGVRAAPRRRENRRAHAARNLSARVQSRRTAGRRMGRDVLLQQGQRHALRRERLPADRHSEEGVRLQGLCGVGLGQHLLDGADCECRAWTWRCPADRR